MRAASILGQNPERRHSRARALYYLSYIWVCLGYATCGRAMGLFARSDEILKPQRHSALIVVKFGLGVIRPKQ